MGTVMKNSLRKYPAPSIFAASYSSGEMFPNAASHMIMPPPMPHSPVKMSVASELLASVKKVSGSSPSFMSHVLNSPFIEGSARFAENASVQIKPGRDAGDQARKVAEHADGACPRYVAVQKKRQHIR